MRHPVKEPLAPLQRPNCNASHNTDAGADGALRAVEAAAATRRGAARGGGAAYADDGSRVFGEYDEDDDEEDVEDEFRADRRANGSRAAAAADGDGDDPLNTSGGAGDVAFALRRIEDGDARRRRAQAARRRGSGAAATPMGPNPTAGATAAAQQQQQQRQQPAAFSGFSGGFVADIEERFAPHIVDAIAGYGPGDAAPDGSLRVGGPHSPFVARQRSVVGGPLGNAGGSPNHGHAGNGPRDASPGAQHAPAAAAGTSTATSPFRGAGPYGVPAVAPDRYAGGVAPTGFGAVMMPAPHDGGHGPGADARRYVHLQLATMQSRPLPSVITPSDLRATRKEASEITVIRLLVLSYLSIVRKTYEVRPHGDGDCYVRITPTRSHPFAPRRTTHAGHGPEDRDCAAREPSQGGDTAGARAAAVRRRWGAQQRGRPAARCVPRLSPREPPPRTAPTHTLQLQPRPPLPQSRRRSRPAARR